jgi:hypothetical protein
VEEALLATADFPSRELHRIDADQTPQFMIKIDQIELYAALADADDGDLATATTK